MTLFLSVWKQIERSSILLQRQQHLCGYFDPQVHRTNPTVREGRLYYTDYDTCAVLDMEILGHQCALWVRRDTVQSLPQECIDQFEDTCGVIVPQQRRQLCADPEIGF
ncbi:hypothetical protein MTO96_031371 [Rhipicephalus appendiculatus]